MSSVTLESLGVTNEVLIDRVVDQLCAGFYEDGGHVSDIIRSKLDAVVKEELESRLNDALTDAISKALDNEVQPRDIWGDAVGEPSTIRDMLAAKAGRFWREPVDDEGIQTSSYRGKPRYQWLMRKLMDDSFRAAVKENADAVVEEFKKHVTADMQACVAKHVEAAFGNKRR